MVSYEYTRNSYKRTKLLAKVWVQVSPGSAVLGTDHSIGSPCQSDEELEEVLSSPNYMVTYKFLAAEIKIGQQTTEKRN